MQIIKEITLLKNNNDCFSSVLLTDGKNVFYNNENKVYIDTENKTLIFTIKKSYSCIFIENLAYVVNEDGNIFCIDLEDETCTMLIKNFGIDCELYRVFGNQLLASVKYNEFYRKAYIINRTDIKKLGCEPENCIDIFGIAGDIYFISTDSLERFKCKCELSIYKYISNDDLILIYNTPKAISLTKYSVEPNKKFIAYANGKKITVYDFHGEVKKKFKLPQYASDINWIAEGKYLLISSLKELYLYDGEIFSLLEKVDFPENCIALDVNCSFDSGYFYLIAGNRTTLYLVN